MTKGSEIVYWYSELNCTVYAQHVPQSALLIQNCSVCFTVFVFYAV